MLYNITDLLLFFSNWTLYCVPSENLMWLPFIDRLFRSPAIFSMRFWFNYQLNSASIQSIEEVDGISIKSCFWQPVWSWFTRLPTTSFCCNWNPISLMYIVVSQKKQPNVLMKASIYSFLPCSALNCFALILGINNFTIVV